MAVLKSTANFIYNIYRQKKDIEARRNGWSRPAPLLPVLVKSSVDLLVPRLFPPGFFIVFETDVEVFAGNVTFSSDFFELIVWRVSRTKVQHLECYLRKTKWTQYTSTKNAKERHVAKSSSFYSSL